MRYITDERRRWRVETTGVSHESQGLKGMGLWFVDDATGERRIGHIHGHSLDAATDETLLTALRTSEAAEL